MSLRHCIRWQRYSEWRANLNFDQPLKLQVTKAQLNYILRLKESSENNKVSPERSP